MNLTSWLLIIGTLISPGQGFLRHNYPVSSLITKEKLPNRELPKRKLIPEIDHHSIVDCLCSDQQKGVDIVKSISSLLPKLDSIAPQILHANDQIIDFTLNSNWIPSNLQKQMVLNSIKFRIYNFNKQN